VKDTNFFVYIESREVKSVNNKLRRIWKDYAVDGNNNLVFRARTMLDWKALQKKLFIPNKNVKFFHDIDDLRMPTAAKKGTQPLNPEMLLRYLPMKRWCDSRVLTDKINLVNEKKIVVAYQKANHIYRTKEDMQAEVKGMKASDQSSHVFSKLELLGYYMGNSFNIPVNNTKDELPTIWILNSKNIKVVEDNVKVESVGDLIERVIKKKLLPLALDIINQESFVSSTSEESEFYKAIEKVPEEFRPSKFDFVSTRKKKVDKVKPKKDISNSRHKLQILEDYFPTEVNTIRKKRINDIPELIDHEKFMEEDPVLKTLINSRNSYYSGNYVEALTFYLKLLKEMENK
jgi:hypothetical protein